MEVAMKSWELDNDVKLVDPTRDALYNYSPAHQKKLNEEKPWRQNPHHFQHVRISAVALIKMVMHARSGGSIEVMGLMQGYVDGDTFVVTDAFGLPVEGTETRVNAQDDANEYMIEYLRLSREQGGREENVVGWYHSHPGYGCWLSGIDVGTQQLQQNFNEPFAAVVIDPDRTISAGRVEIGAFRTFPESYKPAESSESGSRDGAAGSGTSVPMAKAADFGAHASKYYSLEVSHFKSTLDTSLLELLWNKYWVQTLSQSPLFTNRDYGNKQVMDLGSKIREATGMLQRNARGGNMFSQSGKAVDAELEKMAKESQAVIGKEVQGLVATEVKAKIFNGLGGGPPAPASALAG
ncbi:COP9 signalosome complex subunit 5 [Pseudomassariella vexata]|uniref:COP9 signalosome complex subunit 5 n=1 Tax=Pseudomassariella vexata TaxID=1141098 RepID=A0A1Y2EE39_9PEZI|nr:COP9 signalosome complex subunit 5 [Pseudomassariella vexata]ORY69667.1 COP9 signalosome complex subunit 5 [Pseudomassariella vexata]